MSSLVKNDLIQRLGQEVRREQEDVQAFDEAAAAHLGIHLTDLRVLGILDRLGTASASVLAREAGLTTGSTTTLVDRLERAGYARRSRDDRDRRRVFIELTEHARQRIEPIWGPLAEEGLKLMNGYSEEELRLIIDYLDKSRALLERHRKRVVGMSADGDR